MIRASVLALAAALLASPAAAQTTWQIDGTHSQATFAVTHMMVATVRGEFGKMSGTVQYDGKDLSSIVVDATIDATTISTREPKRDAHLKSADFFDVEKYPAITFKSKRVVPGTAGNFKLVGDLTMRGVTREVTLDVAGPTPPVKGRGGETRVGATATTTLNRKDFGVSWSAALDGGGVVVGDEVKVTIDLALVQKST
ncbi:MAG: YceI family protein [Vicinamibacteraceae bacterium]|nr:YceI family protein [Vicinamibacteraceae bacterium]